MSIPRHRPKTPLCFTLLGAGMLSGLLGLGTVLLHGQPEVYNATRELPWGILIAAYILLVVSSTGLGLAAVLGSIFRIERFDRLGKGAILLAILTLLCGLGVVALELHHPFRMALYASGRLDSAARWTAALYGTYLVLLCCEFLFLVKGIHKGTVALGIIGFIAAFCAHSDLLAVFGLREDRHFWPGSILPIYFIFSALVTGGVVVSLIAYFNQRESALSSRRYCGFTGTLLRLRCFLLTVLLFSVILGIFFMRYHPAIFGQAAAMREGSDLMPYTPSLADVAILIGAISTCLYLYAMAEKFLSMESEN